MGGFVRDMLLGIPNDDIDLVVEGGGVVFAQNLALFQPDTCQMVIFKEPSGIFSSWVR